MYDKQLVHLHQQCFISETLWETMSSNIDKITKTVELLGIFELFDNFVDFAKTKDLQLENFSTDKKQ